MGQARHKKRCVVCGAWFECPPSTAKLTCSKECRSAHMRSAHINKSLVWSTEARARKSRRGQDENLKKGTPAARQSPRSGPFVTNVNAQDWVLRSPEGEAYHVHNLNLFCRERAAEYGSTPEQMSAGIRAVKAWKTGRRKATARAWKGWELVGWEEQKQYTESSPDASGRKEGIMKTWTTRGGCKVVSLVDDNYGFEVYVGDTYLGVIRASDYDEAQDCINALDQGKCPMLDSWEDGSGALMFGQLMIDRD